ncbi:unnamed protein product [Adineta steineri]|uniref:Uncharacterized protein n=1 Tax=Adineta steineri TaxID=433720 RepID=A0A819G2X2_9BILA|nr:unnamed protein product [Adineta steineri]
MAADSMDIRYAFPLFPINDMWPCPACSFKNTLSAYPYCQLCSQGNSQSSEDVYPMDHPIPTWQCSRCTLNNRTNNERCEACSYTKEKSKPDETVLVNSAPTTSRTLTSLAVCDREHDDELNAENVFQHIVSFCKQAQTHFVDDGFVPSPGSIGTGSYESISQWLRISDVAPLPDDPPDLPWTIFSSPQPSDIQQGVLGDCWLVAALALISERPRLLEHILLTKQINSQGVYLVRICHNGLWKTIIVDDCFPCTKHKRLVFTQAKRRQLFVPLIEKACAKLFGSYSSLKSGNMLEGLQLLTGAPCDYIDLKPSKNLLESDIVWAKLLSACESKLLIGASTSGTNVSRDEYARVNIRGNHAFSLLAAHALVNDTSRFVLIRDPHSRSRYTEDLITEPILEQLRLVNPTHRSTGAFWISWPRFLHYFSSITISCYNSNHFDIRQQGQFTESATQPISAYCFHVPETSLINISLLYHRHSRTTHSTHTQSFVLCDIDESDSFNSVGKRESILVCRHRRYTYWTGLLRAGSYVLVPFSISFWGTTGKNRDYTVVIHSSVQLDLTIKNKRPTFLADCLIAAVMKTNHMKKQENDGVFYITSSKLGLKLFIAENLSRKNYLNLDIDVLIAENVRHSRFSQPPFHTRDCIPPRYRQLVFITEWTDKRSGSAQLSYSYSCKHDTQMSNTIPPIKTVRHDLHSPRAF